MSEKIMEEEPKGNDKEKELINKEEFKLDESSSNFKQRLIVFIVLIILFLIIFISMIVLYSLNNNKEKNEDDVEVLPPLVFNSTSGNHTHTIIFMPG